MSEHGIDPVAQAKAIVAELKKYDEALYKKPRWLVLNKLDMLQGEERAKAVKDFLKRSRFKGPVFEISALTREGCEPLIRAIYPFIEQVRQSMLLNTQKGTEAKVNISQGPRENVKTLSGFVPATRYSYTGDVAMDQWFDDRGRWVKTSFQASDGSTIEYVLQE
mgnify:CR=1 FL=1